MLLKLSHLAFAILLSAGLFANTVTNVFAATVEEQTVTLINSERQKQGLSSFNFSDKLFQSASKHNTTMSTCAKTYGVNSCFKHQVTLLSEPILMERVKVTGYNPRAVAENIAWGYTSPASVVSGWMGSSGHKANILGSYKDVGCDFLDAANGSYTGMYWTCVFGTSFSISTAPTPTLTPTKNPTPTPTYVAVVTATPTPIRIVTSTPTPTPTSINPTPTEKPWWCVYVPTHYMCK